MDNSKQYGSIGWGVGNANLNIRNERRVMREQPHKKAFDHAMLRNNLHMETSGHFSNKVDSWLGIPYHMLDQLAIRDQRFFVKQRVQHIL
jgi:hypothetical protein